MDTPGIGESNAMKSVLLDYVNENNIYGFIYVIKSDNAGGVAADRVQYFMSNFQILTCSIFVILRKLELQKQKSDP